MAIKITPKLIEEINEMYLVFRNKSHIARQIGCAPATISKYIIEGYVSKKDKEKNSIRFTDAIPPLNIELFRGVEDWGSLCALSDEEKLELKELEKEV